MPDYKKFFKGLDELSPQTLASETPQMDPEFGAIPTAEELAWNRRSFLKASGFAFGATLAASCSRAPVEKAIPYLVAPEQIVPGRAYWMASTCGGCSAGCGVLVKCRDGRPIKFEGNPQHPISAGGLCAVGQASVLGVYDSLRLDGPLMSGKSATWKEVDAAIASKLASPDLQKGRVRFLTSTIASPTLDRSINDFLSRFADGRRVTYDALSSSAILDAHSQTHGARVLPRYRFDRADAIVSVDVDFLGTWISPVEFTAGYTSRRRIDSKKPTMSWHAQLESRMSLTGSNADERIRIHPRDISGVLDALLERIAARAGQSVPAVAKTSVAPKKLDHIATKLWEKRGASLVISGSQSVDDQLAVNRINQLLGNYGTTIDVDAPSLQRQGSDAEVAKLIGEMSRGEVDALFVHGANPLYDLAGESGIASAFAKVPLVVTFASHLDETSAAAHFVCPDHHFLESWSDRQPVTGIYAVTQPTVPPLKKTRNILETLAIWSGKPSDALTLIRQTAQSDIYPQSGSTASFDSFWDQTLNDGFATFNSNNRTIEQSNSATIQSSNRAIEQSSNAGLTLVLYPTVAMLDGRHAHNAWLHELPDPVTKATWDNYASLSPALAKKSGLTDGDVVKLEAAGRSLELPVLVQPGQHDDVIAVAVGYGRKGTERFSTSGPQWFFRRSFQKSNELVGKNANVFASITRDERSFVIPGIKITKTGRQLPIATTQMRNTLEIPAELAMTANEKRPIVRDTTLAALVSGEKKEGEEKLESLWNEHPYAGHKWAMAIDLSACTGCSGCVISCQAENNVPVVGKDEVLRQREMHWMRVDRYYSGSDDDIQVVHQPMLCQHCGNASCESVCPVLATVHSSEGLNQQIYNRCVGTRYCANNCAYKTRRFNWFDYPHEDRLANMALNPDVTIRSRGVMEKCSMCVQRIENVKIESKRLGRPIADGEIRTACQQSCPAQAIVFGDLNDPKSRIAQLRRDKRHYLVLQELNLEPSVGYLEVVRNREEEKNV